MRFRVFLCLMSLGFALVPRASGQLFAFSASANTNSVVVNSPVTYTVDVTNVTGVQLLSVLVTNRFAGPAAPQFVNATNSQGNIFTNATSVAFELGTMINGGIARMSVTLRPTAPGWFTNFIVIASTYGTNTASTNIAVQATPLTSDLAVLLTPPVPPLLVNDLTTYSVIATNLGTNAVAGVILTNAGFDMLKLISLTPTNQAYTLTNGLLLLNLGTLTNRAGRNFQFVVEPTNSGVLNLSASLAGTNIVEANTNNNFTSTNINVGALVTGDLLATNSSPMVFNPQTSLMEQTVRLVNISTNTVNAARIIISGLTNRLYNAVGTNSGNPFVVYAAPLSAGAGVDLRMEYVIPTRTAINVPNSAYTAVATETVNLSVGAVAAPNITLVSNLGPAGFLIEFESLTNRTYTIYYSGDSAFTEAYQAQPSVTAQANRTQWIDNGPPKTASHPSTVGSRFYRVLLNP